MVKKKLDCSKGLQSGHSMFTKNKVEAQKCVRDLNKLPGQTKVKLKKTKHTLRGDGWLIQA